MCLDSNSYANKRILENGLEKSSKHFGNNSNTYAFIGSRLTLILLSASKGIMATSVVFDFCIFIFIWIWSNKSGTNSNAIVSQSEHLNSAAALCLNSTNGGQSDWYLPSILELNLLINNYFIVSRVFEQISGATQLSSGKYWSSSENNLSYPFGQEKRAYYASFFVEPDYNGESNSPYIFKNYQYQVRAIRAF